jgi:hypothetical protein
VERIKEAVLRARAKRAEAEEKAETETSGGQIDSLSDSSATPAGQGPLAVTKAVQNDTTEAGVQAGEASVGNVPSTMAATQALEATSVAEIKYKQTRVVHLNPQHLERNRIISFSKSDARTISFDRLRTQVLRTMRDYGWRTLAITSPTGGCGKTTVALNLALSIAHQTEQTVLLADFDLRDPQIAEYLGLPEAASLVDYLNGDIPLSQVFVNPGIPRLTLLPNHKAVLNATETLMTKKMQNMVVDIRNRYESRMVIFDLPPLLTTDDALAFLPQVDCVLLVVASGQTSKSEVKDSVRLLQNNYVLGSVLNKADEGLVNNI